MTKKETREKKASFLALLPRKNYHIGKTCDAVKLGRRTFYTWLDNDKEFKDKYEELLEFDIDDSEEKMKLLRQGVPEFKDNVFVGWIEKPHFQALALHLQSKAKDRGWGQSIEVKDSREDMRKMSDQELFNEVQKLAKDFTNE